MAILRLEVFKKDFILSQYEKYEKGYHSLTTNMLRSIPGQNVQRADEVFIMFGDYKHLLKTKK